LTALVLETHGLASPTDLVGRVYGEWGVPQIAAIAPLVFRAAGAGDALATAIVAEAAGELALAATTCIRALDMAGESFEIVTAGGIWQGAPDLGRRFPSAIALVAPAATVVMPKAEPVAGAILLAREAMGVVRLD